MPKKCSMSNKQCSMFKEILLRSKKRADVSRQKSGRPFHSQQTVFPQVRANETVSFRGALFCLRFWASKKVRRRKKMKIVLVEEMVLMKKSTE
ncbi:hypothetical protein BH09BAC5_BH09BAC5_24900 [soil metagenome]